MNEWDRQWGKYWDTEAGVESDSEANVVHDSFLPVGFLQSSVCVVCARIIILCLYIIF